MQEKKYVYKIINQNKNYTYVKILINQKLNDLSGNMKAQIICEANNALFQFNNTNLSKRKSFFSYSYMFRYKLNKLKLYKYIDRFKPLKTKSILKTNKEVFSTFN